METSILFRSDKWSKEEKEICRKYFPTFDYRMLLPANSLVVGRYSVLPFYYELEQDLKTINSNLINSFSQHNYIANFTWYEDIAKYTPKTYFDVTEASQAFDSLPRGMVLKGRTNSLKSWENMYAKDKESFYRIDKLLMQNELTASQGVVYREYVPLEVIEKACLPGCFDFVNEWRCFFYGNQLLTFGYYWSIATEEAIERVSRQNLGEMLSLAKTVANIICKKTNFFVLDLAKTQDGRWIVVEVNDGQMSGLSMCNPELLYGNLKFYLKTQQDRRNDICYKHSSI
jgi:hypothetical protein